MARRSRVMQLPLREVFGLAPSRRAKAPKPERTPKPAPTARKPRK